MKKITSYFIAIFVLAIFTSNGLMAQDKIYKKNNNEVILAEVIDVGNTEIQFKLWEKEDGLTYAIQKSVVTQIEYESGGIEYYDDQEIIKKYAEVQKRRVIKINPLGPIFGQTAFSYEQVIKPGRSWEVKATFIGLGYTRFSRPKGFVGSIAYKLTKQPSFISTDTRRPHILEGAYLKPELFFGKTTRASSYNIIYGPSDTRRSYTYGGLLINFGKQWVFGERLVMDFSAGIGLGFGESFSAYVVLGENYFAGAVNYRIGYAF